MKCKQKRISKNLFLWNYQNQWIYATDLQFMGAYGEYLTGKFDEYYDYDWKGKKVLDIGGFIGDSALFFFEKGADQVIIYEPLQGNLEALNYNLKAYKTQCEIYAQAIAQKDGQTTLSSETPEGDAGFGIKMGKYQMECEGISIPTLLKKHSVDVIKMDCEGGERFLAEVSPSDLQSVPYWIIETHHQTIYQSVVNSFLKNGFKKTKDIEILPHIHLLHFSLA